MKEFITIVLSCVLPCLCYAQALNEVRTFAYQLQDILPSELAVSTFDLIIMDYSSDGSKDGEFKNTSIDLIRGGKPGRIVLAYMSIGEAEDYRFYFRKRWIKRHGKRKCGVVDSEKAPAWLDLPNPDFCGNYKVRYWDQAWKNLIYGKRTGSTKSYVDRIIDAGFQGVYLDIIDGYEYWKYDKKKSERRASAPHDMANLVIEISRYARKTRGKQNFIIVPQNGAGILEELSSSMRRKYLSAIDGIGAEDTFYYGDNEEDNSLNPQESTIEDLNRFVDAGKKVLAIDYLTDESKIADFKSKACLQSFVPQVSVRELNSIAKHLVGSCS